MSAKGQKRTLRVVDDVVGSGKQTQRDRETKRLGGLKIDHQFVLGRRLHRKIGGLLALEKAIDVAGRAPELVGEIGPIGDQTAVSNEESVEVDRGYFVLGRKPDDQIAMSHRQWARRYNQPAI